MDGAGASVSVGAFCPEEHEQGFMFRGVKGFVVLMVSKGSMVISFFYLAKKPIMMRNFFAD